MNVESPSGASAPVQTAEGTSVVIPPRSHYRPPRVSSIPPQPTPKGQFLRLGVLVGGCLVLMLLLLTLAVRYAQRDWRQKNVRAREMGHRPTGEAVDEVAEASVAAAGQPFQLYAGATDRQLRRMATDGPSRTGLWMALACGLAAEPSPSVSPSAALRMALVAQGDSAEFRNAYGGVLLRQNRPADAKRQFQAAERMKPGMAPMLFNWALCELAFNRPQPALMWLTRYLARRPEDTAALRLQSTLLTRLGRPETALDTLEIFLRGQNATQPLFLEAALLAARMGQNEKALRYLEMSLNGNPVQMVAQAYHSPLFREIRLSGEGQAVERKMVERARAYFDLARTGAFVSPTASPLAPKLH